MNAIVKYPGAKWSLADWVISHFPEHHSYMEPFFGSGAVLFTKSRSNIETVNDLDGDVVNLFDWIRKDPERLAQAEKDGQPQVGDWVYCLWDVPTDYKYIIYCAEVKEIRISMRNCRLITTYLMEPIEYRSRRKEYRDDDLGKTVFPTREEAEAALSAKGGTP